MLIRLDDIHVYYGHIEALRGVRLETGEGEIVALLGANGAGKSTTLMTISGVLKPRAGKIFFQDRPIQGLLPSQIVRLGISHTPEGRGILARMTVKGNLEMGAFVRQDGPGIRADLEWVYSIFPILKEREGQKGGTLSGGEQQMLAIGRSLMSRPRLLLLDEPSLGLAPLVVRKIFKILQEINARGTSILLVEQNARLALSVARKGYVLEEGGIAVHGSAQELIGDKKVRQAYLGEEVS